MNASVIGTGRVGLVVVAGLADFGFNVYGVDSNKSKIAGLQNGKLIANSPALAD